MKTLLPFHPRKVRGETIHFVMQHVLPQQQVWVNCEGDDFAYYRAMMQMWRDGETFTVLEHDVVPTTEQWAGLGSCRELWCAQGYGEFRYGNEVGYGWVDNGHPGRNGYPGALACVLALGCTKFSDKWIAQTKDRVLGMPPTPWYKLDSVLFSHFPYGPMHAHLGSAEHIKPGAHSG